MFGVASMLCRLGVRPSSTSALATRAVADFMATLVFVNYERDVFLSSYTSDPVLTFGAVKVWYEFNDTLVKYILPQLKKLLLSDVLDSGGVTEMVACILMLLAMDKCVMDKSGRVVGVLIGQLVPVEKFLEVLQVKKMKWEGWYVGFTHFVQLVLEPDENTLWYLLGRRAAGVFPRGQNGTDLLIPMFKRQSKGGSDTTTSETSKPDVSLMLVQVGNRSFRESEFTPTISKGLSPCYLFDPAKNPLSKKADSDAIRIYMDVGEESNGISRFIYTSTSSVSRHDSRVIGSDSNDVESWCGLEAALKQSMAGGRAEEKTSQVETVFTLCFRSINSAAFPFLSEAVCASLASLVESEWLPTALMAIDLEPRDRNGDMLSGAMPRSELQEIALRGLTNVPGHEKVTAKNRAADGKKREKPSPTDRGELKKIKRT